VSGRSEVVSVIRHEVRPDSDAAYEAWIRDVVPIAQTFPGHQGVVVIRPGDGSRTYTAVLHFDTREHLRDWLDSDARLAGTHRLDAVRGHLAEMTGDRVAAVGHYLAAAGRTASLPEKNYLMMRAARLRSTGPDPADAAIK